LCRHRGYRSTGCHNQLLLGKGRSDDSRRPAG
jgi:hypothetical protein